MHTPALPDDAKQHQSKPPIAMQPVLRFHAYNEGTVMWSNKLNAAYRLSRHNMEFFPSDYSSQYVFHFQFGGSGPHSYVIMDQAGSSLPTAPESTSNQYGFQGHNHQQFQWAGCTYAWGRVVQDGSEQSGSNGGCLSPARPWAFRCVELQTGRWVCAAIPRRAFRKLGYIDVYEPSLQHVLVATAFKVLDSPFK